MGRRPGAGRPPGPGRPGRNAPGRPTTGRPPVRGDGTAENAPGSPGRGGAGRGRGTGTPAGTGGGTSPGGAAPAGGRKAGGRKAGGGKNGARENGKRPAGRPAAAASRPAATSRPVRVPPDTVSPTSARRFAARARSRRRRRWLAALLAMTLLGTTIWLLVGSPWTRLRVVQVTGLVRVPRSLVDSAAAGQLDHPLLLVDTDRIAAAVRADPHVLRVSVQRSWPDMVKVSVVERVPIAVVPATGGLALVDADGRVLATTRTAPANLPLVHVDVAQAGAGALRAAVAVVQQLPADLHSILASAGATSPDAVWLRLADGSTVQWGSAEETARKSVVLRGLMLRRAARYDVSAPGDPAVSGVAGAGRSTRSR